MAAESNLIQEGEIVAGKYRVDRVLGQGGMGVVVGATHLQLDQRVALKFLLPSALANPEVVARFTREARAAVKIQSEHVTRVLDVGATESGAPFMVMEYLDGQDLEQVLAARGPLPIAEAVDCLLQGCEAVAEAHALGIVHRDLKPANLFLARRPGRQPIVKVLDFGISKAPMSMNRANAALTQTSAVFGSPLYMSPEQATSSGSVDARADIWSLGVVLYELLTHHHAFACPSIPEVVVAILQRDPDPPSRYRSDLPAGLEIAILRCLEKDPNRRFADVAAFAAAIAPFGSSRSSEAVERISLLLGVQQVSLAETQPRAAPGGAAAGGAAAAAAAGRAAPRPVTPAAAPVEGVTGTKVQSAFVSRTRVYGTEPEVAPAARPKPSRFVLLAVVGGVVAVAGVAAAWRFGPRREAPPVVSPAPAPATPAPTAVAPPPAQPPPTSAAPASAPTPTPSPSVAAPTPTPTVAPPPAPVEPNPTPTVVAPPPDPVAAPEGHRDPAPRPPGGVAPNPEKRRPPPRPAVARPPAPPGGATSPACARLLERLSLGETLTSQEKALYKQQCRR